MYDFQCLKSITMPTYNLGCRHPRKTKNKTSHKLVVSNEVIAAKSARKRELERLRFGPTKMASRFKYLF
jgi:hypothetical protein